MPYVICVNLPGCLPERGPTAVATIEEARDVVCDEVHIAFDQPGYDADHAEDPDLHGAALDAANALPDTGGVIGPLPNGYVIDVQQVSTNELRELAGMRPLSAPDDSDMIHAIDAYNEES